MKQMILLLFIIYIASVKGSGRMPWLSTDSEDEIVHDGPALNVPFRENYGTCENFYIHKGNGTFGDEITEGMGVSGCVDLNLYSKNKKKYFDKCCYIRAMIQGQMYGGCIGIMRNHFTDITDTITKMEKGDKNIWTSYANNSKIYVLDCNSSYLQSLTLVFALLSLLF